jgi:hypothetical protein
VGSRKAHDSLLPNKRREARDSVEHPDSVPIIVFFDVTGSMGTVPVALRKSLPTLMDSVLKGGALVDPQILFGAIGDSRWDESSLQCGEFEAGIESGNDLDNIFIEGGGGGGGEESYELAMWWALNMTDTDAWEKRGRKGHLFIIGDERFYPSVRAQDIRDICGQEAQGDVDTLTMIQELRDKWHVFLIRPPVGHGRDKHNREEWGAALGYQNVIDLDSVANISEYIAGVIAKMEDVDVAAVLKAGGASARSTDLVLAATAGLVAGSKGSNKLAMAEGLDL